MKGNPSKYRPGLGYGKFHLFFNGLLVLLMLVSVAGVALAQSDQTPPPGEHFADDPYSSWDGEFMDFIPPNPEAIELAQPDGSTFQALLTPMETGGQLETLDGYTVVTDEQGISATSY